MRLTGTVGDRPQTPGCPPWPGALCQCGHDLASHLRTGGPDTPPSLDDLCPDIWAASGGLREVAYYPADPGDLDCVDAVCCAAPGCRVEVCGDHSDDADTCEGLPGRLLHEACHPQACRTPGLCFGPDRVEVDR